MLMILMVMVTTCGSAKVPLVDQMNLKCFTAAATTLDSLCCSISAIFYMLYSFKSSFYHKRI